MEELSGVTAPDDGAGRAIILTDQAAIRQEHEMADAAGGASPDAALERIVGKLCFRHGVSTDFRETTSPVFVARRLPINLDCLKSAEARQ